MVSYVSMVLLSPSMREILINAGDPVIKITTLIALQLYKKQLCYLYHSFVGILF